MGETTRILHVEVGGSYGGSLRALEVYLRHADRLRLKHDVLLYYPTPGSEVIQQLADRFYVLEGHAPARIETPARRGTMADTLRRSGPGNALSAVRSWIRLLRECRVARRIRSLIVAGKYDVIHVNNTFSYQPATLLAGRWSKVPVIAHVRNPVRDSRLNRLLLRITGEVICINALLARQMRSYAPRAVVHTACDGAELPAVKGEGGPSLRRRFLPGEGMLIGSIGRLDHQKGYDMLIRAACVVLQQRPDVRLVIGGEGPERSRLEELIRNHGIQDKVHLAGFVNDTASFLSALDLFVCSSRWEGGPLTVAEALLLRKPVVSTAVGFVPELLGKSRCGELVPCGDHEILAAAIVTALSQVVAGSYDLSDGYQRASELLDPVKTAEVLDRILCVRQQTQRE